MVLQIVIKEICMFDEMPVSRMFIALVPLDRTPGEAKKAARKKIMEIVTLGNRDKKHSYKITKEWFERCDLKGKDCMRIDAFVECDAFVPSKYMEWLLDRGGKQENFDSFIQAYTQEHPEWQSLTTIQ